MASPGVEKQIQFVKSGLPLVMITLKSGVIYSAVVE